MMASTPARAMMPPSTPYSRIPVDNDGMSTVRLLRRPTPPPEGLLAGEVGPATHPAAAEAPVLPRLLQGDAGVMGHEALEIHLVALPEGELVAKGGLSG